MLIVVPHKQQLLVIPFSPDTLCWLLYRTNNNSWSFYTYLTPCVGCCTAQTTTLGHSILTRHLVLIVVPHKQQLLVILYSPDTLCWLLYRTNNNSWSFYTHQTPCVDCCTAQTTTLGHSILTWHLVLIVVPHKQQLLVILYSPDTLCWLLYRTNNNSWSFYTHLTPCVGCCTAQTTTGHSILTRHLVLIVVPHKQQLVILYPPDTLCWLLYRTNNNWSFYTHLTPCVDCCTAQTTTGHSILTWHLVLIVVPHKQQLVILYSPDTLCWLLYRTNNNWSFYTHQTPCVGCCTAQTTTGHSILTRHLVLIVVPHKQQLVILYSPDTLCWLLYRTNNNSWSFYTYLTPCVGCCTAQTTTGHSILTRHLVLIVVPHKQQLLVILYLPDTLCWLLYRTNNNSWSFHTHLTPCVDCCTAQTTTGHSILTWHLVLIVVPHKQQLLVILYSPDTLCWLLYRTNNNSWSFYTYLTPCVDCCTAQTTTGHSILTRHLVLIVVPHKQQLLVIPYSPDTLCWLLYRTNNNSWSFYTYLTPCVDCCTAQTTTLGHSILTWHLVLIVVPHKQQLLVIPYSPDTLCWLLYRTNNNWSFYTYQTPCVDCCTAQTTTGHSILTRHLVLIVVPHKQQLLVILYLPDTLCWLLYRTNNNSWSFCNSLTICSVICKNIQNHYYMMEGWCNAYCNVIIWFERRYILPLVKLLTLVIFWATSLFSVISLLVSTSPSTSPFIPCKEQKIRVIE